MAPLDALGYALDKQLQGYGDRLFLADPHLGTTSFAAAYEIVAQLASRLLEAGIRPGSLVGVHGLSPRDTIFWFLASVVNRYLFVPLNDRESLAEALSAIRETLTLDALVLPGGTPFAPSTPSSIRLPFPASRDHPDGWDLWLLRHEHEAFVKSPGQPGWFIRYDEPVSVLLTSGSTGRRKGVLHTFGNHFFSAAGTIQFYQVAAGDSWLLSLPLFHVGGLLIPMRCLLAGATCLIADPDPHTSLDDTLVRQRPAFLSLVPTQLFRLLAEHRDHSFFAKLGMKALLLGGATTPRELLKSARAAALPISLTYGCTEAASQVTATAVHETSDDPLVLGQLLPWRKLRVMDGLVHLAGETLFAGYIENDRLTRPHDKEGWWHTADHVTKSDAPDQTWRYLGRADDIMIVGGENLSPHAVETILGEILPAGALCRVAPYPDAEYGVVPILILFAATKPDIAKILAHLTGRISGLKIPKRIYWYQGLPEHMHKLSTRDCLALVHKHENGTVDPAFYRLWGG